MPPDHRSSLNLPVMNRPFVSLFEPRNTVPKTVAPALFTPTATLFGNGEGCFIVGQALRADLLHEEQSRELPAIVVGVANGRVEYA